MTYDVNIALFNHFIPIMHAYRTTGICVTFRVLINWQVAKSFPRGSAIVVIIVHAFRCSGKLFQKFTFALSSMLDYVKKSIVDTISSFRDSLISQFSY